MNASYIIHSSIAVLDSRGRAVSNHNLSLDIPAGGGVLKAGTFLTRAGAMATRRLPRSASWPATVDATAATSGVVYLTGSFLRKLVVAANSGATIDDAFEDALRAKGIYLERSIGLRMKLRVNLITQGVTSGMLATEMPDHSHSGLVPIKAPLRRCRGGRDMRSGGKNCEPKPASVGRRPKPRRWPRRRQGQSSRPESWREKSMRAGGMPISGYRLSLDRGQGVLG